MSEWRNRRIVLLEVSSILQQMAIHHMKKYAWFLVPGGKILFLQSAFFWEKLLFYRAVPLQRASFVESGWRGGGGIILLILVSNRKIIMSRMSRASNKMFQTHLRTMDMLILRRLYNIHTDMRDIKVHQGTSRRFLPSFCVFRLELASLQGL